MAVAVHSGPEEPTDGEPEVGSGEDVDVEIRSVVDLGDEFKDVPKVGQMDEQGPGKVEVGDQGDVDHQRHYEQWQDGDQVRERYRHQHAGRLSLLANREVRQEPLRTGTGPCERLVASTAQAVEYGEVEDQDQHGGKEELEHELVEIDVQNDVDVAVDLRGFAATSLDAEYDETEYLSVRKRG